MALVVRNLWVKRGTLSLPGRTVPFWGFAPSDTAPPRLPGPTIEARVGDMVFVLLRSNELNERVSIMFPGQRNVRVIGSPRGVRRASPKYADGRMISFTDFLDPSAPGHITYVFNATRPGVYLYESGTSPERQVQMGLYGVVLIRPRGYNIPTDPDYKTAYGAGTGTRFDVEKTLVLSDIDTLMHEALDSSEAYNILDYSPDYWMINGRSYPDTVRRDGDPALPSQPSGSSIAVRVGQRLLLRIINAGFQDHTLHFGGLVARVVAGDGYPLTTHTADASYEKTAITLGSGQSFDVMVTPTSPGEFYLRNRNYNHLVNLDSFPGGMMTRLDVAP